MNDKLNAILHELQSREPIFHHPEKFGTTREDIENQMAPEYWEVGASGKIYTREFVIQTLLERYKNQTTDIWEAQDFQCMEISENNYLLTYTLIQNKTRITRRATIWRKTHSDWKIVYHQGTLV